MFFGLKRLFFFFGGVILTLFPAISFAESTNVTRYALLPETAVLARANGQELTKAELERELAFHLRLKKHRKPSLSAMEVQNFSLSFRRGAPRQFVRESLLAEAAAAAGVTNATATLAKYRSAALRNFKGRKDKTFDDLKQAKGIDGARLEAQIEREALVESLRAHWVVEQPFELAPDYPAEFIAKVIRMNEQAAQTNALQFVKATNVWERLKAGEDFTKVGCETTELEEDREGDLEWGDYDTDAFEEAPELLAALKAIKPGGFTPPIEADNGIVIVRLDDVDTEDGMMSLSRIFFHEAVVYEVPTPEQVVANAKREHEQKVFAERMEQLWKAAKIEFPFKKIDFTPLKEEEEE